MLLPSTAESSSDNALKSDVVPFVGLRNKGNTCYLNSVLQILYYCPAFNQELLKVSSALPNIDRNTSSNDSTDSKSESQKTFSLIKELGNVFSHLDENQTRLLSERSTLKDDEIKLLSAVCPQSFIDCLRNLYPAFEPYTQQDAQECFHCILNICNSVMSSLNERAKESVDIASYVASDSKVVGGRRSHATSVLSENQQADRSKSSDVYFDSKHVAANDNNENGARDNGTAVESSPPGGCFSGLKRKQVQSSDKSAKLRGIDDEVNAQSRGKENESAGTIDSNGSVDSQPAHKKRRFGTNFRIAPPKHPSSLKSMWKAKNQNGGAQRLSKFGEKLAGISASIWPRSNRSKPAETKLISAVEDTKGSFTSDFVKEMFQGQLVTTTRCTECETSVSRFESFQDVSLPVKDIQPSRTNEAPSTSTEQASCSEVKRADTCSLSWALDHFTSTEALSGDNKYFCGVCKRLSEGDQRMRFKQLPPVLTLHLKRFSTASISSSCFASSVSKITSALEIPSRIRFGKWCSRDCSDRNAEYQLFGIVIHSGLSITVGHYLSYVKYSAKKMPGHASLRSYDGQWLEMDDDQVRLLTGDEMKKALKQGDFDLPSKSAYMLFYHRFST